MSSNITEQSSRNAEVLAPPLILLTLITVLANITVILCVIYDKKLRNASNVYVVSLAVADLIVGVFVMGGMNVFTIYGYWPLGNNLCTAWVALDFTCCTVSIFHLILVAYDRFLALNRPLQYKSLATIRRSTLMSVGSWIVGLIVWLPPVITFRVLDLKKISTDCYFVPDKKFVVSQAICVYYIPILAMIVFYTGSLRALYRQKLKVEAMDKNMGPSIDDDEVTVDISVTKTSGQDEIKIKNSNRRKTEQHTRVLRTLGVIILMFLVCWLPFCIMWPMVAYCNDCVNPVAYENSYWLAYVNSTINPLLYFVCNRDFRTALRNLFKF
ncbi:unnamed protein product [Dimorphilus gyrociliatus]|uniref:G-protein coupled receptors family 1 profile domain-containing protein n=1 Tax=Dimorphilus gyrociliatus TaxID=2664684 RepID=A0A7I8VB47_9ANNE|nr:unnamed protein product [Dimorphilus gyrociliatus]